MRVPSSRIIAVATVVGALACAGGAGDERRTDSPAVVADSPAVRDTTVAAAPADTATRLTADGWGPLRIGMTRAEVVAALGEDASAGAPGGPDPASCDEFHPARAPRGLLVMIERGRLTRISLGRYPDVKTTAGLGVGDSVRAVLAAHPRAERGPHKYQSAPAEYVTVWSPGATTGDARRGIVYEIGTDARVMRVHAGGPSIQYVEGCL